MRTKATSLFSSSPLGVQANEVRLYLQKFIQKLQVPDTNGMFYKGLDSLVDSTFSYDVAIIRWYDHTCNNILARTRNVIYNAHSAMRFLLEILFILKAIKSHFKGSYDKENFTLVTISYEFYETSLWRVS